MIEKLLPSDELKAWKLFAMTQKADIGLLPCKNKTDGCWNPDDTNAHFIYGLLKDEALKNSNSSEMLTWLLKFLSEVVSCVRLLLTFSKLALVN